MWRTKFGWRPIRLLVSSSVSFLRLPSLPATSAGCCGPPPLRLKSKRRLHLDQQAARSDSDVAASATPASALGSQAQCASAISSSAAAAASDSIPDALLASSILLRRLAERKYSQQQVRQAVQHLLRLHNAPTPTSGPTVGVASTAAAAPARKAAPLSRAAYEVMLSAAEEARDVQTFDLLWTTMQAQFSPRSGEGCAADHPASALFADGLSVTPTSASAVAALFHPSALMYLCRMSMQMHTRQLSAVEDTFHAWKRSGRVTELAAKKDPSAGIAVVDPPNLLAFHLLLRKYLLSDAEKPDPQLASKCMALLQDLKLASNVEKNKLEVMRATAEAAGDVSAAARVPKPALKAQLLTYHLLLQALLPRAVKDIRHLTPLLLDMQHAAGLSPDWTTFALALHICLRAAQQARDEAKRGARAPEQAQEILDSAWNKAEQLWKQVQQRGVQLHSAAVELRKQRLAEQEAEYARELKEAEGKVLPTPDRPPPPASVPPIARMIPAPLWVRMLEIAVEAGPFQRVAEHATIMQRTAGVIPPSQELVQRVLERTVDQANRTRVPPLADLLGECKDDEDRVLTRKRWTSQMKAAIQLQQQAITLALQMLRCSATIATATAAEEEETKSEEEEDGGEAAPSDVHTQATADDEGRVPASPVESRFVSSVSSSAAPLPFSHYLLAFDLLSKLGRVDEFAKLWAHFMAHPPAQVQQLLAAPLAKDLRKDKQPQRAGKQKTLPVPPPSNDFDRLVRFALRLDNAAFVGDLEEGEEPNAAGQESDASDALLPSAAPAEAATFSESTSCAGGELAYSMCTFFARQAASAVGASSPAPPSETPASSGPLSFVEQKGASDVVVELDLLPVLSRLPAATRQALLVSLLSGQQTGPARHLLSALGQLTPDADENGEEKP